MQNEMKILLSYYEKQNMEINGYRQLLVTNILQINIK